MASIFTYNIANDFPPGGGSGLVNTTKFNDEILASSITTPLTRIDTDGNGSVVVYFSTNITVGEKTTLDGDILNPAGGLIAVHDSTATTPEPVEPSGIGDLLTWNGISFVPASPSDAVSGVILNDLLDVNVGGAASGNVLKFTGVDWTPQPDDQGGGGGVFGSEYHYAESLALSTTTLQDPSWTQKLKLTTAILPIGTYIVHWSCGISVDGSVGQGAKNADCQLQLDDATVLGEGTSRADTDPINGDTNSNASAGGTVQLVFGTAVTHDFDIDFRVSFAKTGTVKIRNARIALWRIA